MIDSEPQRRGFYDQALNTFIDCIQSAYTQKRIAAGTAVEKSTSNIVFTNLKQHGVINGLSRSARDLKNNYNEVVMNVPVGEIDDEDKILMTEKMVWAFMLVGAAQIMLTIAGVNNIDNSGHWNGFLPLSND